MKLHCEKLHTDILIKLAKENKSKDGAPISNSALHRLSKGDILTLPLLINCFEWLEKEASEYIN